MAKFGSVVHEILHQVAEGELDAKEAEIKIHKTFAEGSYDRSDMVRRLGFMMAGPLKLAAYQVRDPETSKFGTIQFHMTYNNMVMAVLDEESAKLFCTFVEKQLNPPTPEVQKVE